jgi:hypothetical protein
MEEQAASGMAKVYKERVPIMINRYKYEIADLQKQLDGLKKAEGMYSGKGLLAWMRRKKLPHLDELIAQHQHQIDALSNIFIEGVLTPLSVRDRMIAITEQSAHRFVMIEKLMADKNMTAARKKAYERSIDLTCDMIYKTAYFSQVLKKEQNKELVQYFTFEQACNIHPQLVVDVINYHADNFILTDDEAGK